MGWNLSNLLAINLNKDEWLRYLENRHPRVIRLGTQRVKAVAKTLNLLNPQCLVVTVAGTNGKGSTVAALEQIYFDAGYRVGAYTSPHLIEFNERIKVNLTSIDDETLCQLFAQIEESRQAIELSYFEMATLAALLYFQHQQVDVIILEVGLGGRLDATNIIDPDVAIITTIDYDHQEYLGHTLNAIGYEKAGILRQDKPFIYADNTPPQSILDAALELRTQTYLQGEHYSLTEQEGAWSFYSPTKSFSKLERPKIQLKSAAAALMACVSLHSRLPIADEVFYKAMSKIFVSGRLELRQTMKDDVLVLFDVSHNPQSARLLAARCKSLKKGVVHAVFAALKDKDILGMILPLRDCVAHWYPAQLTNQRAVNSDDLVSLCNQADILVDFCYTSPVFAFEAALECAKPGDLLVVFGSFLTVGQVMAATQD
jgi:dihydrofolate synthase/folylpolyglutamate synthase